MTTRKLTWIGALLLGLCLGLLVGTVAHAESNTTEEATVSPATPPVPAPPAPPPIPDKKHHEMKIEIHGDEGAPISKELRDKLTPDQLFQLEQMRLANEMKGDIPGMAPLIVAIVFGFPVAIVVVVLIFRQRRNAMLHKTLAAMIDKGVPIPPELLTPAERRPKSDLRRGITLVATGIGMVVFFALQHEEVWGLGLIPLLIGIGYLVVWRLDPNRKVS